MRKQTKKQKQQQLKKLLIKIKRIKKFTVKKKSRIVSTRRFFNDVNLFLKKGLKFLRKKKVKFLFFTIDIFNKFSRKFFLLKFSSNRAKDFFFLAKNYSFMKFKFIKSFKFFIYGVSLARNFKFLIVNYGVNLNYVFSDIDLNFLIFLQNFILTSKLNLKLKAYYRSNLMKKRRLKLYQGIRYKNNLPVRGQRTYSNAGTSKRLNLHERYMDLRIVKKR